MSTRRTVAKIARVSNRLDAIFAAKRAAGQKALVIYATSADPDPAHSPEVFLAAAAGGADVLEIGVPFSDPTADGPAIQAASQRALAKGGGFATALDDVRAIRGRHPDLGVILFGYANPFLQAGDPAARAAAAGADGILCVDLPPQEDDLLGASLAAHGLHAIRLLAPTSTDARIRDAAATGGGFLYLVSVTGVTGGKTGNTKDLAAILARIRRRTDLPIVIGFGISTPDDAARLAPLADGVVVGSAIVRLVAEHGANAPAHVERLVRSLADALR